MKYDKIIVDRLQVYARHGVFPEENETGQTFVVSLILYTDTRKAGRSDDLTESIHYGEVCEFVNAFMKENTFKLLEKVAEELAEGLLLKYDLLKKISVRIDKPSAPIALPFETVAVEIERGWHKAYIALGSNMGDKQKYLDDAVNQIKAHTLCKVNVVSDFIETKPYGGVEQDFFLNGAMEIETLLTPFELLDFLHEIEQKADRKREIHWGPRTLDLDILFYDDEIIDSPDLTVPHIDMANRDFVLLPMKQIAPYMRHPVSGKTVGQMAEDLM